MDTQPLEVITDGEKVRRPVTAGGRRLRWVWGALLLVVAAAAAYWLLRAKPAPQQAADAVAAQRPVVVATARAVTADLPVTLDALGTATPLATVTVRTRIPGHLVQVAFREGQHVRKSDFLALVDPRPYQAALEQAEGQLAKDQAFLRNAEVDLARYRRLVAEDSIARQQLDTQESLVRQYRATLQVDQAQVDSARLNLSYCRIVSPIDGRVGLRQVDEGNYVQTSDENGIVVVTQMQPMTVVFSIAQDDLPAVLARLKEGARLPVTAFDRSGTNELGSGELATVDNQIDPATGTIKLKALFKNADERLYPNQFVNVRLRVDTARNALVVPSSAVQRGAQGSYVYVVTGEGTAMARPVRVGLDVAGQTEIKEGLATGDVVVTGGVDRLRDGIKVRTAEESEKPQHEPAATGSTPAATPQG